MTDWFAGRPSRTHYDEEHRAISPVDAGRRLPRRPRGGGAALELAIGTGRIALPLAARGVRVLGIDLSATWSRELRAKPGGTTIPVDDRRHGDDPRRRDFALVYLVFNTILNLTTQDAQVACFDERRAHLEPGGCFVVEARAEHAPLEVFELSDTHVGVTSTTPTRSDSSRTTSASRRRWERLSFRSAQCRRRARPDGAHRRHEPARAVERLAREPFTAAARHTSQSARSRSRQARSPSRQCGQARRVGALAAQHRVRGPRRRTAELRGRDPAHAAVEAGLFEDRLGELRPRAVAVGGDVPEPARQLDELARRRGEMTDVRRAAALVVDDRDLVALARRARSIVRTKLWPVQPKSHDERTIHASSPAAASPCSFVRPYDGLRVRRIRLDVRLALAPVEDVVGREVDERRAELGRVLRAADVDRRRALRVGLGAVDVRPRGGVQHEIDAAERRAAAT